MSWLAWLLWGQLLIRGAWVHRGDGSLPVQADVLVVGDSIAAVAPALPALPGYRLVEARGKHLYPGLIGLATPVGLVEIEAVRATRDYTEVGEFTPEVRAYAAFNIDSRVLPTLAAAGILYVEAAPVYGLLAGQSAVLRLSGRTREAAVVLPSAAIHSYPPSLRPWPYSSYEQQKEQRKDAREAWQRLDQYLEKAARWCGGDSAEQSFAFQALCPCLRGQLPIVWHVDAAEDIEMAVRFAQRWGLRSAIAGGAEAPQVASLLRETQTPVLLLRTHRLPSGEDAPLDQAFLLPKVLRDSGITVFLAHESFWNQRNLAYNAGTAAAYGLPREEALAMLSSRPAEWLGLSRIGRIAPGCKASLLLTEGDLLDPAYSRILQAWIEGREVPLSENMQEILFQKYRYN